MTGPLWNMKVENDKDGNVVISLSGLDTEAASSLPDLFRKLAFMCENEQCKILFPQDKASLMDRFRKVTSGITSENIRVRALTSLSNNGASL